MVKPLRKTPETGDLAAASGFALVALVFAGGALAAPAWGLWIPAAVFGIIAATGFSYVRDERRKRERER